MTTIPECLYSHYKNQPDREAVVFAHSNGARTVVTFKELYINAAALAKSFLALGVKKTEIIAISMRNCPEWLYATLGAMMAGARPISLSFTYTDGSDVVAMMRKLETCSAIVLDPKADKDTWNSFRKLILHFDREGHVESDLMPYLKFMVCRQTPIDHNAILTLADMLKWENKDVVLPHVDPDDTANLFQTSGSTGEPKVIVHTHRSLIESTTEFNKVVNKHSAGQDAIGFNNRGFTWMGGFPASVLITGETRVTSFGHSEATKNQEDYIIDVIKREKCTYMFALPPLIHRLMNRLDDIGDDWPISTIRTGGSPISCKTAECIGKLCRKLVCNYAATEFYLACGQEACDPNDFKEYSVGHPFAGVEVKILAENGAKAPVNDRGEIYIKSKGMFKGYLNDPEKTKACLSDDGWFRTDDIGYLSYDGLLYCEGRKSDTILAGEFSLRVSPLMLESVIQSCQGVARVVCVPVSHNVMYQVICACIIIEDGIDVTEEQLRKHCEEIHNDKQHLFTVVPAYYLFLEQFPETSNGKVSRKELSKLAASTFQPEWNN